MLGRSSLAQLRHGANSALRLAPPVPLAVGRASLANFSHRQLCFASASGSSAHAIGDAEPAALAPAAGAPATSAASTAVSANEGASRLELWHALLRLLHEQGDFEDPDTPV